MYVRPFTLFSTLHPFLLLFYALGAPILAMFGKNPVFLGLMFCCALCVHGFYLGSRATRDGVKGILFVVLFVASLNLLTNPMGVTELFKIGGRLFTLESLCYGVTNGLVLGTVILWFRCFTAVVPNDKFLYLFGRKFQTVALLLSMILKLFPETRYKIRCIRQAQMPDDSCGKVPLRERLSQSMRQMSSLLEWSMEDGIETADAMKARGYGESRRTSYEKYRFVRKDCFYLSGMCLLYRTSVFVIVSENHRFTYYPTLGWTLQSWYMGIMEVIVLVGFLCMPIWMETARKGMR